MRLAAALDAGTAVDLRDALPGLGTAHARRVLEAVLIAVGMEGFWELREGPKMAELHQLHQQMGSGR